jgi:hypothetical protein
MIAPAAVLTGLILLARRNFDKHHREDEEDLKEDGQEERRES